MAKWRSGEVIPSRASAVALERDVPGTLWLFDLPLFPFLADQQIRRADVRRAIEPWRIEKLHELGPDWELPPDDDGRSRYYLADTSAFVHRGDIWGLAALVALMRQAEVDGDQQGHCAASMNAFRALPALMQTPWCAPSAHSLFELLIGLQRRMPYSFACFEASWNIIQELSHRGDYQPDPQKRRFNSARPYAMYPDPIVPMQRVPYPAPLRW